MDTTAAQQLGGTRRVSSYTVSSDTMVFCPFFFSAFVIESCSRNPDPLTETLIAFPGKAFIHSKTIENNVNKQAV